MNNVIYTYHFNSRRQQRSFKSRDIELIEEFGTYVGDGIILSNDNISKAILEKKKIISNIVKITDFDTISQAKNDIDRLEKLREVKIGITGEIVTTIKRARSGKERRKLAYQIRNAA